MLAQSVSFSRPFYFPKTRGQHRQALLSRVPCHLQETEEGQRDEKRVRIRESKEKLKGAKKNRGAMIFLLCTSGNTEYLCQIAFKLSKE